MLFATVPPSRVQLRTVGSLHVLLSSPTFLRNMHVPLPRHDLRQKHRSYPSHHFSLEGSKRKERRSQQHTVPPSRRPRGTFYIPIWRPTQGGSGFQVLLAAKSWDLGVLRTRHGRRDHPARACPCNLPRLCDIVQGRDQRRIFAVAAARPQPRIRVCVYRRIFGEPSLCLVPAVPNNPSPRVPCRPLTLSSPNRSCLDSKSSPRRSRL